jgi:hypothetical protein
MLSVAALVLSAGEPSWQVLGMFAMVSVIGLGLRLEARFASAVGPERRRALDPDSAHRLQSQAMMRARTILAA